MHRNNSATFFIVLFLMFVTAVVKAFFAYATGIVSAYESKNFAHRLRCQVFDRYMQYGKLFFDRSNLGSLTGSIFACIYSISDAVNSFGPVTVCFFTVLFYFGIMMTVSWQFTTVILSCILAVFYFNRCVGKLIGATSKDFVASSRKLHEFSFNVLSCIPLVKSYANESESKTVFNKSSKTVSDTGFRLTNRIKFIMPLQEMIVFFGVSVLAAGSFYFIAHGRLEKFTPLLAYLFLLKGCLNGISELTKFRFDLSAMRGSMLEIIRVLDMEFKPIVPDGNRFLRGFEDKIEFRHLSYSYLPEVPALKDISFTIKKGKMTAIVGRTGGGKTTLIHLLLRFYDCPPESILIDGQDIRDFQILSLMNRIAFVSQEPLLFNDTFRHNIGYGLNGKYSEQGLIEVSKKARIHDFIISLPEGYDTYIGDKGVKLSGGEKQRVQLARAMFKDSEILLLDEATSSLDSQTEHLIQEAIDEAIKDKTAIVIAHRLSTIQHADKIVVLEEGEVKEEGTLNELLHKQSRFFELWQAQKFD